jgi:DNA-binding NarL/FixJ family response regulator
MGELLEEALREQVGVAVSRSRRAADILPLAEAGEVDAIVCWWCAGADMVSGVSEAARRTKGGGVVLGVAHTEHGWQQANRALGTAVQMVECDGGFVALTGALRKALRRGAAGRMPLEVAATRRREGADTRDGGKRLTGRQREVLELLARGRTSGEIARELGLSRRTVDRHRSNLMKRLRARSAAEAVRKAMVAGDIGWAG